MKHDPAFTWHSRPASTHKAQFAPTFNGTANDLFIRFIIYGTDAFPNHPEQSRAGQEGRGSDEMQLCLKACQKRMGHGFGVRFLLCSAQALPIHVHGRS